MPDRKDEPLHYPLPSHRNGRFYPAKGCGWCGCGLDGRFVTLNFTARASAGGAASVAAEVQTSWSLLDHGVTASGRPLIIFQDVEDAYFCSPACLRAFFNQVVTDFEQAS
ncbi:hypothetical protein SAMN02745857_03606 [Andreprevotia lacus DSM 23236]|jgi:hypothetical protein|uniref:Uncharacterized protein n=1 Tax=Andreprevotia lacus DSM 23236 TaxID=1121001 RepID=A0A1W1XZ09_9NEIS|nr:hypothetical protein [Andreprevotia lacus]SMC29104.1 hypothetical protein SAMN02745857_03606 [Andreprevotia lacus DSM 23236]